jgi:hypothetical protein
VEKNSLKTKLYSLVVDTASKNSLKVAFKYEYRIRVKRFGDTALFNGRCYGSWRHDNGILIIGHTHAHKHTHTHTHTHTQGARPWCNRQDTKPCTVGMSLRPLHAWSSLRYTKLSKMLLYIRLRPVPLWRMRPLDGAVNTESLVPRPYSRVHIFAFGFSHPTCDETTAERRPAAKHARPRDVSSLVRTEDGVPSRTPAVPRVRFAG